MTPWDQVGNKLQIHLKNGHWTDLSHCLCYVYIETDVQEFTLAQEMDISYQFRTLA